MKIPQIVLLVAIGRQVHAQYTDFWFWKIGHLDGPHSNSRALGISRDGHTAVGYTTVVSFEHAWRCDIDWFMSTTEEEKPPLYNELFVQEELGVVAPSKDSAAYAASDMTDITTGTCTYDRSNLVLDWCGSTAVGNVDSDAAQWLLPVFDQVDEGDYVSIQDFGGGLSEMVALDVSADGLLMAGYGNVRKGPVAFFADMSDPILPVVHQLIIEDLILDKQLQSAKVQAMTADGSVIVGYGYSQRGGNRAFVSFLEDMSDVENPLMKTTILPTIGGGKFAEAYAVAVDPSTDALYIAGRCDTPKGPQACVWFEDETTGEWAIKPLGSLSQKDVNSAATGIAYVSDGSVVGHLMVTGYSATTKNPKEAFVWAGEAVDVNEDEPIGYMHSLEYILTKTGVGEESGMGSDWILYELTGLSALGDRMVGWGQNPEGNIEAFVVTGYPYGEMPDFSLHE